MRRIRGIAGLGLFAAMGLKTSPVAADDFGTYQGGAGAFADSALHNYCQGTIPANRWDNAQNSMNYLDVATDINVAVSTPCTATTDVRFDNHVGMAAGDRGDYACLTLAFGTTCDASRVRLQQTIGGLVPNSEEHNLDKTIRHEIGHTVGMRHYKDEGPAAGQHDCMISGAVNLDPVWISYSAHHKDHVNNAY